MLLSKEDSDFIKLLLKQKRVKELCKVLFRVELTPTQEKIIRSISYQESKRIIICCLTRYGKSFSVALAVLIYILRSYKKKILLLSPTIDQTNIIRSYISVFIVESELYRELVDINLTGLDKLKAEVSKKKITFKNGCELLVLSAEGSAERLMGHGADGLVILDESCLISYEVYRSKISRMLGDHPNTGFVEIGNPWDRDNQMFQHWISSEFLKYHVDENIALKEGRTTQEFLDEQKKLLTPVEYQILYKAEFPEESVDSLYKLKDIEDSYTLPFNFESEFVEIEDRLLNSVKFSENEVQKAKQSLDKYTRIISCDPADKGMDRTVIYWGIQKDNSYQMIGYYVENKSESMQIVGKIMELVDSYIGKVVKGKVIIDKIGIGTGAHSRLSELIYEKGLKNITLIGAHFGESAIKKEHFLNKKAENYFRSRDLLADSQLKLLDIPDLKNEMLKMKWELTSGSKKKIIDPEDKSPDFNDCLTYFVWRDKEFSFDFL